MKELLSFTESGIYCPQANVYIDPWKPVQNAITTHGHEDHARYGHKEYLCHHLTEAIIKYRLGEGGKTQTIEYNDPLLINNVKFRFHPAGHIPGSLCQEKYIGAFRACQNGHFRVGV